MFYTNVCGNVQDRFLRSQIDEQLKAEVQHNLQPALGKIALKGIAYDQLPLYTNEIADELNQELTEDWVENRGISVISVALASITPDAESAKKDCAVQESRVYTNSRMMGARLGGAQANAMENAASNAAGAMTGFFRHGHGAAGGAEQTRQLLSEYARTAHAGCGTPAAGAGAIASLCNGGWQCPSCGAQNSGNFCANCGTKRPAQQSGKVGMQLRI